MRVWWKHQTFIISWLNYMPSVGAFTAGLTQDELADATGVSRTTIILIKLEKGSNPQIGTAKRFGRK